MHCQPVCDIFSNTCKTSDKHKINADAERTAFKDRLAGYSGALINFDNVCNIACIESAISKLNNGKAAGFDLITSERVSQILSPYCLVVSFAHV